MQVLVLVIRSTGLQIMWVLRFNLLNTLDRDRKLEKPWWKSDSGHTGAVALLHRHNTLPTKRLQRNSS
jgi:hypothetical protein